MSETTGQLRVWHIPNPPQAPFHKIVTSVEEAKNVINLLSDYDNFLGDDHVYANASGLEVFESGDWVEWHDDDDRDLSDILLAERYPDQPAPG